MGTFFISVFSKVLSTISSPEQTLKGLGSEPEVELWETSKYKNRIESVGKLV